jgi:hypothetical protein
MSHHAINIYHGFLVMDEEKNYKQKVQVYENYYYFKCPGCQIDIVVEKNDLNCKVFRCGVYRTTGQPIAPHLSKDLCDALREKKLIYGCGRPFIFKHEYVEISDYI